jgi:hypothetical protein
MIDAAVRLMLTSTPAVAALVGARIYPGKMEQGSALPAIVYDRVITTPAPAPLEGAAAPVRARLRLSCWADSFDEARGLWQAVKAALEGRSAMVGLDDIRLVRLLNWFDGPNEPGPPARFRVTADFHVYTIEGEA